MPGHLGILRPCGTFLRCFLDSLYWFRLTYILIHSTWSGHPLCLPTRIHAPTPLYLLMAPVSFLRRLRSLNYYLHSLFGQSHVHVIVHVLMTSSWHSHKCHSWTVSSWEQVFPRFGLWSEKPQGNGKLQRALLPWADLFVHLITPSSLCTPFLRGSLSASQLQLIEHRNAHCV